MSDTYIPHGSHWLAPRAAESVAVNIISGPTVELVASLQRGPLASMPQTLQATTVAIHMDQSVATDLFLQLRKTFQTMGWPLPTEVGNRV